MAKSLIKTVDGIGIWVRDNDVYKEEPFGIRDIISILIISTVAFLVDFTYYKTISLTSDILIEGVIFFIIFFSGLFLLSIFGISFRTLPAYEIYPGTETGIIVFKTTPNGESINNTDQLAICKAVKEIEARCHEIAAKRRELDRIAGNCK
jgi:hypothetical protein